MDKEQNTIDITKQELKNIMEQFEPNVLMDDDEFYKYKEAMRSLQKSDQIIIALYAELQSERKVAELLGVSRSPIHKLLSNIRQQIMDYLENKK